MSSEAEDEKVKRSYKTHVGKDCIDGGCDGCCYCEYEVVCKK